MPPTRIRSSAWPELLSETGTLLEAFLGFARWRGAGGAALIGLGALFDGLGLLLLVPVLGLVVGSGAGHPQGRIGEAVQDLTGGYPLSERLLIVLGAFSALMLIRGGVLSLRDRVTQTLQLEFVEGIRLRLVSRLASAGWPAVARASHARIVQALSVEIHQVGVASSWALLAVVSLVVLAGHCILALILAPLAGILAIAFALAGALISRPYLSRSRRLGRAITEAHFDMAEGASTFMGGLKLALAQGLESRFVALHAEASSLALRDRLASQGLQSRLRSLTSGGAALAGAAMVFAGVEIFHLAAPVLITLLVVLSRIGALVATVQQCAQQITHSLSAYGAILAVEAGLAPAVPPAAARRAAPPRRRTDAALVFERVGFAHEPSPGRPPELSDVDLEIPAGTFVGVVGPSGVGKTTFLDLASGVLRPQSGRVWAFDLELDEDALPAFRARLAYVAQDAFLFDGSVRGNLAWSAPGCSETEMLLALEAVGAQDLLARLDRGLDTRIGRQGALISAGERQRLALAGAILRRPRLLLLDEATNAIDVMGERIILETLASLRPQATILMVAHRAESLRLCDATLRFPGPVLCAHGQAVREAS